MTVIAQSSNTDEVDRPGEKSIGRSAASYMHCSAAASWAGRNGLHEQRHCIAASCIQAVP